MSPIRLMSLSIAAIAAPAAAFAQEIPDEAPVPQVFTDMIACRTITEDAARLACYDRQVTAVQQAQADEAIIVVDRAEVREAERGLFGLRLPRIRLFGGSDENRVNEIESTITSVSGGRRGQGWTFELADGSLWSQTDLRDQLSRPPREGHAVTIRRAALGSFRAEIDGMRLIRVERVR